MNISPTVVKAPYNATSTNGVITFNFDGRFEDYNNKQTFTLYYKNNANVSTQYDFVFTKIKSLQTYTADARVNPAPSSITANRCQIQTFNITFTNVKYSNPYVAPVQVYGTVTNYEYLLPSGWKLGATTSNGSTWLAGNNNVIVTSDLAGGIGGFVKVRPVNTACGSGLAIGEAVLIPIFRPGPTMSVSGPNVLCTTSSGTYSLSGLPSGATVSWGLPNSTYATIPSGSTGSSVVATATGTSGNVLLTATVTHCTFTYTVTRLLKLGSYTKAEVDLFSYFDSAACRSGSTYASVDPWGLGDLITNFQWDWTAQFSYSSGQGTSNLTLLTPSNFTGGTIRVKVTSSCGTSPYSSPHLVKWDQSPDCGPSLMYNVYPNPAADQIQITDKLGSSARTQGQQTLSIEIVDKLGIVKLKSKYIKNGQPITISTSSLPNDVYTVRIFDGKESQTQSLIIRR